MELMAWTMEPTTDDRRPTTRRCTYAPTPYALRTDAPLHRAPSTGVHRDERSAQREV